MREIEYMSEVVKRGILTGDGFQPRFHKSVLKTINSSKRICVIQTLYTLPFHSALYIKMSSIKQLIVNAIIKVSTENPSFNHEGEPTAEEARDNFIKLLLAELFPEDPAVPVIVPTALPATIVASPESSPSRKKRAPMSDEAKALASAKRKATLAAKKAAAVSPASENPVVPTSGSNAAAGGAAAPAEPVKELSLIHI